jgi:hypothetical protein
LPPPKTLEEIPESSTVITTGKGFVVESGCIGPNNCWSQPFKWTMAGLMLIFVISQHLFKKIVMLGWVAETVRRRKKNKDYSAMDSEEEDVEDWHQGE